MHFIAGPWMAAGTVWSFAQGWQTEIGLHDLAWFGLIVYALVAGTYQVKKALALTLTLLSVFLGANHAVGLVRSHGLYLHVAGTIANAIAVIVGAFLQITA